MNNCRIEQQKNYYGLDIFKFIAAIFILSLHVNPFGDLTKVGEIVREIITPLAVPFFFAAAGFLAYKKLLCEFKVAVSSIKKNLKLYVIWSIIYFPFVIFSWFFSGHSLGINILLYIRDFIFEGSYLTIWFLNALAWAFCFEWVCLKRFKATTAFIISIPFFAIGLLLSSYNELLVSLPLGKSISNFYYTFFSSTKNGLLFGFPFVAIGCAIASKPVLRLGLLKSFIGVVISFVLLIVEIYFRNTFFPLNKSVDFCIFHIFISYFLISIALQWEPEKIFFIKIKQDAFITLRKLSILIFLTQRIFIFSFEKLDIIFLKMISINLISSMPVIHFILVAGTTILCSIIILKLSERWQWLKNIY